ncbi:CAP domain-containing protein [Thermoactinomyces mirandus]|uniref:SCP domain-containing protein n=1 Tax=Thermoactinomyces mirandus TaxID=2756294 RepID=A0A7W1XS66_9BACL|nr:CAP domain-containing protein [Thermoactinomyces mirandus]MBA4602309.1 hypothetical protein [Thermoactinomyces mirandus]
MSLQALAVGLMLFFSSLTGFDAVLDFFGIDKQVYLEHIQQTKQAIVLQETGPQNDQSAPSAQPAPSGQSDALSTTAQAAEQPSQSAPAQGTDAEVLQIEKDVFQLVNQEREKRGLKPLRLDADVSKVADRKSQDMKEKHYFDHQSPTYGSPFEMLQKHGIPFRAAGENIAAGQKTAKEVTNGWMNSEGHSANILNPDYTHIGIGYVQGGDYGTYWTQIFIQK